MICNRRDTPTPPQVHFAHMCAYGGMWGWLSILATFNPASIHLFDAPQLNTKGLHIGRESFLWSWWGSWKGCFWCLLCHLYCRLGGCKCDTCRLLRGQMGDSGEWGVVGFLGRRWGWRYWGCAIAPLRSLQEPSTSEPATANSTFPNPSVSKCRASSSNQWASSFRVLDLLSRPRPWKKK